MLKDSFWPERVYEFYRQTSPLTKFRYLILCYIISYVADWFIFSFVKFSEGTEKLSHFEILHLSIFVVLYLLASSFHYWKIIFLLIISFVSLLIFNWSVLIQDFGPAMEADKASSMMKVVFGFYMTPFFYIKNAIKEEYKLIVVNLIYYFALAPVIHYIANYNQYKSDLDSVLSNLTERVKRLTKNE